MRDVVVIGAGHNSLTAACYLARAGLDVEVVERDTVIGGAVSTVERWPGFRVDRGSSVHLMVRQTGIVEELELAGVGLRYLDLDPWAFVPVAGAPGGGISFHTSLEATCASIAAVCGRRDADAYAEFVATWTPRARRLVSAFHRPPTPGTTLRFLASTGRGESAGGAELSRQFLQSAESLVAERFTDERLRTALCWLAAQSGPPPWLPGTAPILGWHATLHQTPPGRPIGGSGALSDALADRLRSLGGAIRVGDGAAGLITAGGRAAGVTTDGGERIPARTVLAGCHVRSALELCGPAVPPALRERAESIRVGNGIGMVVRLAGSALPHYPGAAAEATNGLQLLASSRGQLRAAHADFSVGRPPLDPAALAMSFSGIDPSLAPAGKHTVSVWGQWHPFELSGPHKWDDIAAREGDRLVAALERCAPGFAGSVEAVHVQTPVDLERELGLLRGNVMHVEMELDALFSLRPLPELAGHRTPVPGFYLTGASTHPGGGVSGASGRSAAGVVLADARSAGWAASRLPRWRRS